MVARGHVVAKERDEVVGHPVQQRVGALSRLRDPLAMQHSDPELVGHPRDLVEQPALATARVGLQGDDATGAGAQFLDHCAECGDLAVPPDEAGVGECGAPVAPPDDQLRLALAGLESRDEIVEIGSQCGGVLIPLGRILAQQPLDDVVDGARHRDSERPQLRCGGTRGDGGAGR